MSIYNVGAGGASNADKISYDNTESGLQAENVQDVIDELNSNLAQMLTPIVLMNTPILANVNDVITLTESIRNFKFVEFVFAYHETSAFVGYCHYASDTISKSIIDILRTEYGDNTRGLCDIAGGYSSDYYMNWGIKLPTDTKIEVSQKLIKGWSPNGCYIYKIIGYK